VINSDAQARCSREGKTGEMPNSGVSLELIRLWRFPQMREWTTCARSSPGRSRVIASCREDADEGGLAILFGRHLVPVFTTDRRDDDLLAHEPEREYGGNQWDHREKEAQNSYSTKKITAQRSFADKRHDHVGDDESYERGDVTQL
jgi:hypothetical protein